MKNFKAIKNAILIYKTELREKYGVKEIGVFGSYARDEQKKKSDVDIVVELEEPVSLLKLVGLENFLSEIVGIKVDVIPRIDIRHELKDRILKEAIYI